MTYFLDPKKVLSMKYKTFNQNTLYEDIIQFLSYPVAKKNRTHVKRNQLCISALVSRNIVGEVTKHIITERQDIQACNSSFKHRNGLCMVSFYISEVPIPQKQPSTIQNRSQLKNNF